MDKFTPNARQRTENIAFFVIFGLGVVAAVLAALSLIFG